MLPCIWQPKQHGYLNLEVIGQHSTAVYKKTQVDRMRHAKMQMKINVWHQTTYISRCLWPLVNWLDSMRSVIIDITVVNTYMHTPHNGVSLPDSTSICLRAHPCVQPGGACTGCLANSEDV